ncbi:hypothetical protein RJ639_025632 [Escallonia herrerae]|uniref:Pentatricopeptide repeat-containing protein n=1 Tax=Escallonia herrerae TaxID=1293975 RepID=A0AA88UTL2_9ASTE|nr:hypothetical protein RJ639_025632 [Escallonia herrerae]
MIIRGGVRLGVGMFLRILNSDLALNLKGTHHTCSNACKLFGIDRNPRIVSDVVEAYKGEGCWVGVKAFKVLLSLLREAKLANEALSVLRMMEFNCRLDTVSYNVVIRLFCEKGDMDEAARLLGEMGLVDLHPDMITYVVMAKGFCDVGRLKDACELFGSSERALEFLGELESEGGDYGPNVVTYASVIQSFCEKGTLLRGECGGAYKLVDKFVGEGNVSYGYCYSSLVLSLLWVRKLEEAEKLFRMMLGSGVKPNGLAASTLIRRLCLDGRMLDGFHLYNWIEKLGCLSYIDTDIYSILLAGLCQEKHSAEAAKLARIMLERRIQLKAPYVDNIVEHLKNSEDMELLLQLAS